MVFELGLFYMFGINELFICNNFKFYEVNVFKFRIDVGFYIMLCVCL